ncbi:C4-dicarboxylate ABC transporter [Trichormus azollae]|uniref:C4-dicarboxylate ABC transporter n=1 Tax=Trichormus azollae TaxID=1164 RepID=UPI0009D95699|nr:C4-dicarboxylate ABC transporter [Trichormus azollae]
MRCFSPDLLTPLGRVLSYCSLLRIAFDAIFGALLFLQCLFSLQHMFVLMLPWIVSLRNFSLWHFMVPNVG